MNLARVMARGTIYLMVTQIVFLASGYIIHFGLGRYLGPELYGTFGLVLSFVSIYQVLMHSGTTNAVSKYVAENEELAGSIKNKALKFLGVFSLVVVVFIVSIASLIANLLKDPALASYIRFTAVFVPVFALYSVYMGLLNGIRAFGKQAKISIIHHITKVLVAFILVLLGLKIYGAIGGYLVAVIVALMLAYHYWKPGELKTSGDFKTVKIIRFAAPVILFSVIFTLIISLDLFFVRAILKEKSQTGFYTSAAALSKVPYFIFLALNDTLFPSIAKSTSKKGSIKLTQRYISQSLRYVLILLIPSTLIISATSENLISLVYTDTYLVASLPLSILIFGLTFLCLFILLTTVITASGRPKVSLMIASVLLIVSVVSNTILVPVYGLSGASIATTITGITGILIAGVYVYRRFHILTSPYSLVRIVSASLVVYLIARIFPVSGMFLVGYYIGLFFLYFALLFMFGEVKRKDIQLIKDTISGSLNSSRNKMFLDEEKGVDNSNTN